MPALNQHSCKNPDLERRLRLWAPRPKAIGLASQVSGEILGALSERVTQIWRVEKSQAVCASLVRGASPIPGISKLAAAIHLVWAALGTRVWMERVDRDPKVPDGLSCAGCDLGTMLFAPWGKFRQLDLLPLLGAQLRQAEITLGGSGDELLALKKPTHPAPGRVAEFRPEHGFA